MKHSYLAKDNGDYDDVLIFAVEQLDNDLNKCLYILEGDEDEDLRLIDNIHDGTVSELLILTDHYQDLLICTVSEDSYVRLWQTDGQMLCEELFEGTKFINAWPMPNKRN